MRQVVRGMPLCTLYSEGRVRVGLASKQGASRADTGRMGLVDMEIGWLPLGSPARTAGL